MIKPSTFLYLAWLISVAAMAGSLFFSNVLGYPPCDLCWWQRIFMYPLVFILFAGLWRKDKNISFYTLVLAIPGCIIALYHSLLYKGILKESVSFCTNGISCTTKYVEYLGFITIPLLSFLGFGAIVMLCLLYNRLTSPLHKK